MRSSLRPAILLALAALGVLVGALSLLPQRAIAATVLITGANSGIGG